MATHQFPFGIDEEERVVERATARLGVPLVHADHDEGARATRGIAEVLDCLAGNLDGVLEQLAVELVEQLLASRNAPDPIGIRGDERFREDDEVRPRFRRLAQLAKRLLDGLLPIEEYRGDLNRRN